MMLDYYDRRGRPITLREFAALTNDINYRIVARSHMNGRVIATVWLGLDHQFGSGPPLIFETMVFPQGSWNDDYAERYSTERAALAGHERAVRWVRGIRNREDEDWETCPDASSVDFNRGNPGDDPTRA